MTGLYPQNSNRRHNSLLFRSVIILLSLLLTNAATADTIVLDDFSTPLTAANESGSNYSFDDLGDHLELILYPGGSVTWEDSGPGIFGGKRQVTMQKASSPSFGGSLTNAKILSGLFEVSHPDNDMPLSITLDYQNASTTSFAGLEFFVVHTEQLDGTAVNTLFPTLRLYNNAGVSREKTFATPLTAGSNFLSLTSLFQDLGTRNVTRATLNFTAPTGADFKINSMAFTPAPEPGSIAACILIAVFCALRVHKRKSANEDRFSRQSATATAVS